MDEGQVELVGGPSDGALIPGDERAGSFITLTMGIVPIYDCARRTDGKGMVARYDRQDMFRYRYAKSFAADRDELTLLALGEIPVRFLPGREIGDDRFEVG